MAAPRQTLPPGLAIEKATPQDIPIIQSITHSAYEKYIPRIGKPPAPMNADWPTLLQTHQVSVLKTQASDDSQVVVGAIVLGIEDGKDSIKINNLVVDQAAQGRGYGKILMRFAEDEARERERTALTLFTNLLMYENLVLYPKLGFWRRIEGRRMGMIRVYYRKDL